LFSLATLPHSVYNRRDFRRLENHLTSTAANASRRWTVIAAGLLILAIGLVVIYAGSAAYRSPLAAVVLAAIGLAAVLFQRRLRQDSPNLVRVPQWLNLIGIVCAVCALFADRLGLGTNLYQVAALGAVGCFGISSYIVLDGIRKSPPQADAEDSAK
jgi:drug/metabolite transporter (DMT)-like permease